VYLCGCLRWVDAVGVKGLASVVRAEAAGRQKARVAIKSLKDHPAGWLRRFLSSFIKTAALGRFFPYFFFVFFFYWRLKDGRLQQTRLRLYTQYSMKTWRKLDRTVQKRGARFTRILIPNKVLHSSEVCPDRTTQAIGWRVTSISSRKSMPLRTTQAYAPTAVVASRTAAANDAGIWRLRA
jgi:hypothetical protein